MGENLNLIDSLLEKASVYGKTSYELIRLQAVDKVSDSISAFTPGLVLSVLIGCFLFFINVGAALWLGEVLGKNYYGFFVVAGFWVVVAFVIRLFFYKRIKSVFHDYIIRKLLSNSKQ
jgi:hypothetical protein